jgi:energy-coupling factor transporter ATP-binding protein EcfA2
MSLLEVNKLEAFYGASQALFGVDLEIAEGELVALMGRNGMGKTTTVRAITRMLRTTRGEIRFDGQDVTALPSFPRGAAGDRPGAGGPPLLCQSLGFRKSDGLGPSRPGMSKRPPTCFRGWASA